MTCTPPWARLTRALLAASPLLLATLLLATLLLSPRAALAQAAAGADLGGGPRAGSVQLEESGGDDDRVTDDDLRFYKKLSAPAGSYARILLTSAFGRGLRFNNPYRLATQLGDDAESLSLTATYFDLGLGVAFGEPDGLQHGAAAHLAIALEGVPQQALAGSYMVVYRADSPWLGYGRIGPVLLTSPDANVGVELAFGGAWFVTGALGICAELVGDLFYGAGTWEARYTVIPILSAQAGVIVDFEVLP